jgi:hypothetical protein
MLTYLRNRKVKNMTLKGLKNFIKRHMLVTFLVLLPAGLAVVISILNITLPQSLLSLSVFCAQLICVILGTMFMYRKFEEEKPIKFTRKLDVLVEYLRDKLIDPAYNYSLPSMALEIARNKDVTNTQAWDKLLTKHSEDLTNNIIALSKRIETNEKQFRVHLNDFRQMLISLQKFKKSFYGMISEAKHLVVYYSNSGFKNRYDRAFEEYNRHMDNIKIFSDDAKVNFSESLDESLTEHLKEFDKSFPQTPIAQPH